MEKTMKKIVSLLLFVLMITLLLTGCRGQKQIQNLDVHGIKTEYELNETPDFSGASATVTYNDGTTKEIEGAALSFGNLDTSVAGKKNLDVTYDGFTVSIQVTVKDASIPVQTREVTGIEYFSGLPKTIFVNDSINFDLIKIVINYSDNTEEVKDIASNSAIKHNGNTIDTTKAGTQVLTIQYAGKQVNVDVVINEILLTGIEIDGDTVDTTIIEGTTFDPTGMVVYALYNNGAKIRVDVANLTITQNDKTVTISYNGQSAELTLSTEPPVITGINITATGYENSAIVVGDKISTAGVNATASYNNGTTKSINNSSLVFDIPTVSAAGKYTVNVSYADDASIKTSYEISVLGITKITISTTNINVNHPVDTEFNTSGLSVIITCSDGSRVERDVADGVIVDASAVKIDTINPTENNTPVPYYITASYGGVTSEQLGIYVYDPDINYIILGTELPESLSSLDSKKDQFINKDYAYYVGDDNGFIFKLDLTILNQAGSLVEGYSAYTSYFELVLNSVTLEGDELAKYASFDGKNNSIDFTEEAIGKTFTIRTRPANGVDGNELAMTRSIDVTVVDGLNIYEAWELNYLTNCNYESIPGQDRTQVQIVDDFLSSTKKVTRPQNLAGVILHNDLVVKTTDIPSEYFLGGDRNAEIFDFLTLFPHATDSANNEFSFYGNYYTIFTYNIPNVCANGTGNQDDLVSSSQLFRFAVANAGVGHNYKDYKVTINSVYLRDDNPNSDNIMSADRDMRGIIGMKVVYQDAYIENVRLEAYYISFGIDADNTVANLNQCKFYNSWQNHIYIWSTNVIQGGSDDAPFEGYIPATLNVTESSITKCGGPVIIAQTKFAKYNTGSKSGAVVNIDDKTDIWTYVTGQEAWFSAMNANSIATQIQQLGMVLKATLGTSYITQRDENGEVSQNTFYMNMIMVNLGSGTTVADVIAGTDDLDGKFTKAGATYMDMSDTYTATHVATGGTIGYGNQGVATLIGNYAGQAPVFTTAPGGVSIFDGTALQTSLTGDPTMDAMNKEAMKMGDYIAMHMNNMGIVLGYGYTE